jgi:hypothetical protein
MSNKTDKAAPAERGDESAEPDDGKRREFLSALGLPSDGPTLSAPKAAAGIALAPEGVDPHTMPVTDIVFDEALLDGFPSLSGSAIADASRHVFSLYKSYARDKDRNSLLHRNIGEFIGRVRRKRETGGFVREQVKATKGHRDLAHLLAEHNITAAELADVLRERKEAGA